MSSDFFRHVGKRRKDNRKNYRYTKLENDQEEIHGQDTTEEEIVSSEIYPLKEKKCTSNSVHYLEHQIQEGDSLQKLSLIYRCPVAELKRANRLLSDQEFYGLKKIRIPSRNHGLLTEILPEAGISEDQCSTRTFELGIGRVLNGGERSEAAAFLRRMDEDLSRIRQSTKLYKDSLEEAALALTSPQFGPLVRREDGADCGLHWKSLLAAVVLLVLVLPVVIVLYLQLHPDPTPRPPHSTQAPYHSPT